jgi:hypothetical protein
VTRKLGEQYSYSPEHGRDFFLIAFGWMWGRGQDDRPDTLAEALASLERGLAEYFEREGIEREE